MTAERVGTLGFVFATGALLTQVTAEVTLEAQPLRHGAIPVVAVWMTFHDLCILHERKRPRGRGRRERKGEGRKGREEEKRVEKKERTKTI